LEPIRFAVCSGVTTGAGTPWKAIVVRSKRGTEVAALFYTLCESAKLQNVEPRAYLLKAAYAAIQNSGTIVLPEELLAESAA
jgi:hypothetical protein